LPASQQRQGQLSEAHRTMRALLVPYAAGAVLTALPMMWLMREHPLDGLAVWALAAAPLAGVAGVLATTLVWRVERTANRAPAPGWWLAACLLLAFVAHWAPLGMFLVVAGLRWFAGRGDFDEVLAGAAAAALTVAAWAGLRLVEGRLADRGPGGARPGPPRVVRWAGSLPTPAILAGLYGVSVLLPSLAWFGWSVSQAWPNGTGLWAAATWSLLGAGAAALVPGGFAGLQQRLDRGVPPVALRIQLAGLVLIAHWWAWFALGLSGEPFRDLDAQYTVLWTAFAWLTFGTWVASVGVALRPAAR
jgi:hypothetical protein